MKSNTDEWNVDIMTRSMMIPYEVVSIAYKTCMLQTSGKAGEQTVELRFHFCLLSTFLKQIYVISFLYVHVHVHVHVGRISNIVHCRISSLVILWQATNH
jgi:hypothetical protein